MTCWLKVRIGGQRWRVLLVSSRSKHLKSDDGGCLVGKCDYERCTIYISKELAEAVREDALVHEFLHALLYVTGAEKAYGGDPKKDEALVTALTPALHALLSDLGFRFPRGLYS